MESVAELPVVDWHRLNKLLEEALELEPQAREAWFAGLTVDDALREALRTLLQRADAPEEFDAEPDVPEFVRWGLSAERPGSRIGPYRLVTELAVGGMGVVWVAERADGSFERRVALKLPRAEWAAPGLAERMARERSILASLSHPNIAQLYDAGWSEQGRPYLAIELVNGVPIDRYCAQHGLDVRRRIALFLEAVRAVAFAHSRLVVHRDLKPANVMVTSDGHAKLLDFGIAKLLAGDDTGGEETALTRAGGRALTLAYAAPEQILGQPVSAATDVYSLGVMLHELLSGTRPYRVDRPQSNAALEHAILNVEPEAPSRASKLHGVPVRGDLDTIVLKALRKVPERRYESAAALADDLERYLQQLPIRARPDNRGYRARLFVLRHRLPIAAGTAVAAALIFGAIGSLWQAEAAREETRRANAIKDFVLSVIRQADPNATAVTRETDAALLATAEARIVEEMGAQPRTVLELRLAIAEAYANRGLMDRARATLRIAIKDAKEKLDRRDPDFARALIAATQNFVHASEDSIGDLNLAIETARLLGFEGRRLLVEGLLNRSAVRRWSGEPDKVGRDLLEAYELSTATFGPADPLTLRAAVAVAWPSSELAVDKAAVIAATYRAARGSERLGPPHPTLLRVQVLHGYYLARAGHNEEAMGLIRAAVQSARLHHGASRPTEEVLTAAILGYFGARDLDAASAAAREAYEIASSRFPEGEMIVGLRATNLASTMLKSRRISGAEELLTRKGKPELVRDPNFRSAGLALRNATLGNVLLLQGRTEDAETRLQDAIRELDARQLRGNWSARIPLAWAVRENGRAAESIEILKAVDPATLVWEDDRHAILSQLAASYLALGEAEDALKYADKAIAEDRALAPFTPDGADAYLLRGRALLALGHAQSSLDALEVAAGFWRSFDPGTPWAAEAFYWHGVALTHAGQTSRGEKLISDALPVLAASQMPSHRALADAHVRKQSVRIARIPAR